MNLIHNPSKCGSARSRNRKTAHASLRRLIASLLSLFVIAAIGFAPTIKTGEYGKIGEMAARSGAFPIVRASNVYANLAAGNLTLNLNPTTADLITSNDDWSVMQSVEGYMGRNLTATHGVDPQTILKTEFTNNTLPEVGQTQVNANKGNPSAFNAGGVTEFDKGTYLAIGFQGNVQANPYMVFFVNTVGTSSVSISYEITDIDEGSNNAVSPIALQYRVGETGFFTNLPDGFIADATDGPNIGGRMTSRSVMLPPDASNQPKVQIRLITTNAANTSGSSTPDEWIGVNNVVINAFLPTAAGVTLGGTVKAFNGRPISRAVVSMTDSQGNVRFATTNQRGKFRFDDVLVGQAYLFSVRYKRYTFVGNNEVFFASDNFNGLVFTGY